MENYALYKAKLRDVILERMDYSREMEDEDVLSLIDDIILEQEDSPIMPVRMKRKLREELFHTLRRLDVLQEFVEDPEITEIMINGPNHIFVERNGILQRQRQGFESEEKLRDVIQQIVAGCNRVVNEASPIVDARLVNGSRVNVVMDPVAINGPIVTIRRFPDKPIDWFPDGFAQIELHRFR